MEIVIFLFFFILLELTLWRKDLAETKLMCECRRTEAPFGRDKIIGGEPERREWVDIYFEEESKRRIFLFAHSCTSPFIPGGSWSFCWQSLYLLHSTRISCLWKKKKKGLKNGLKGYVVRDILAIVIYKI